MGYKRARGEFTYQLLDGDSLVASWEIMASFGRFVELGKADVIADNDLPMQAFARTVSFIAVNTKTFSCNRSSRSYITSTTPLLLLL